MHEVDFQNSQDMSIYADALLVRLQLQAFSILLGQAEGEVGGFQFVSKSHFVV